MILLQKKRKKKLRSTGLAFDIVIISILSYLTRHFRSNVPNPCSLPHPPAPNLRRGYFLRECLFYSYTALRIRTYVQDTPWGHVCMRRIAHCPADIWTGTAALSQWLKINLPSAEQQPPLIASAGLTLVWRRVAEKPRYH